MEAANRRVVIVGLDGMPFGLISSLATNGTMPNTRQLIERKGTAFRRMASSIPEVSSVAWSSIITGTNPGKHGIFGFTDLAPGTYRLTFPNFSNLRAPPFWEQPTSGRTVVLNVPSTFPARPLDGAMVSGFVALDLERAVYPAGLIPWLKSVDYQVDVDAQTAHQSLDLFLRNLDRTLQTRIVAYRHLWEVEKWSTFILVFTGTDRLAHFLWGAYENEKHPYHGAFLNHLRQVDQVVGEIADRVCDEDVLILLSDHGFEALEGEFYLNAFLREEGFLKLESDPPRGLHDLAQGTRAFALDPGRLYLNLEDKYPRGSVRGSEQESVLRDIFEALEALEINGRKVIRRLYRKEELYDGPCLEQAPDLVALANRGFNLRGNIRAKQQFAHGTFAGKHSQDDAFLLVSGELGREIMTDHPNVSDVAGIVDKAHQRSEV